MDLSEKKDKSFRRVAILCIYWAHCLVKLLTYEKMSQYVTGVS